MAFDPPLRFTSLKLANWRNFRQVDLLLESKVFFVGPNASGKSNLLDSIRFLADIANPGSGGLQAAIERRGGFAGLRSLHARKPSDIQIEVSIGDDDSPRRWEYSLKVNVLKKGRAPIVLQESVAKDSILLVNRTRDSEGDVERSQTALEQVSLNKKFRPLVDFFSSCRYLHVVPQIVRDRTRAKFEGEDPYGGDLLRRMKAMPKKMRIARLARISRALSIAVPQFDGIELEDDIDGIPHLLASFVQWRASKSKQSEAFFSDGTLRLIGLLWSISERGGPLLLEEPELSLNDAVITQLPKMFSVMQKLSGRQVIATTHSSALIDDSGVGLREIHRLMVDANGSSVETAASNQVISAQVKSGMPPSQAIFPLLQPVNIEELGDISLGR